MQSEQARKVTLFDFCGNYKYTLIVSCILSVISAVLALLPFICIWKLINQVLMVFPDISQTNDIGKYGWAAFSFALASIVLYFGSLILSHKTAFYASKEIRRITLDYIVKLPLGYFSQNPTGKLRKIINTSASDIQTFIAHNLPDLAGIFTTPVAFLVIVFIFDWRLGLACLFPMIIALMCMGAMMGGDKIKLLDKYQNSLEDMNAQAVEYVRGMPVVKVFQQTVYSFNKFHSSIQRYRKLVIDYALSVRGALTGFNVAVNGIFALLIPVAVLIMTNAGNYRSFFLDFVFYVLFAPLCALLMSKVVFTSDRMIVVMDAMKRINSILQHPVIEDGKTLEKLTGYDIEFSNVKFAYGENTADAINNLSFKIKEGTVTALVGPSGSGKTTVARLLSRYWDVDEGLIKIGGTGIRDVSMKELMSKISYVFQDTHMLKDTLLENVRIAKQDAAREEVIQALKDAQCEDVIQKLPMGIDTVIGSGGVYLSGGEQQRVSIARAILKDSPIIVLDEATSFADMENEHKIQASLEKLMKGKTILMIAHRLTTVQRSDQIILMNNGKLEEQGSHNELLKQNGLYCKMWNEYLQAVEWKV